MLAELRYRVTVDAVIRFEERAGVGLFSALANQVASKAQEEVENEDEGGGENSGLRVMEVVKAVFKNSLCLSAFIYECGLSERDRTMTTFSDWTQSISFLDILGQYDACIEALFLSSPSQTTTETGEEKIERVEAQIEQDAKVREVSKTE